MVKKEVIGVIHLPRLPRVNTRVETPIEHIIEKSILESKQLDELGYTGVILENFGDAPFNKRVLDPLAIAYMSIITREVVKNTSLKVGVNLLRNSGREAYSIAIAAGAKFIRVNALVETIVSDSGIIEPEAPRLSVVRMNYPGVEVYADILVKHAASFRSSLGITEALNPVLSKGSIEDYLRELIDEYVERGKANALIVTGLKTGEPPPIRLIQIIKKYSPIPVMVGSGVTIDNLENILKYSDGIIVGSYIRKNGKAGNPLDPIRAKQLILKIREYL
ncbi:MAG: BtpA/SgcQ family protein [Desulfurococcaceae archaeon]